MPKLVDLAEEELRRLSTPKTPPVDISQYAEAIATIMAADDLVGGEVKLLPGENMPTIKRRLNTAGKRANEDMRIRQLADDRFVFTLRSRVGPKKRGT